MMDIGSRIVAFAMMVCAVGMVRPLRIDLVDAFYHNTSRGDRREANFDERNAGVAGFENWSTLKQCKNLNFCSYCSLYAVPYANPIGTNASAVSRSEGTSPMSHNASTRRVRPKHSAQVPASSAEIPQA